MTIMLSMALCGVLIYLIGHVLGLAHGIEVERRRWKIKAILEDSGTEKDGDIAHS